MAIDADSPIAVRLAGPDDLDQVNRLARAMEDHYDSAAAMSVAESRAALQGLLFGPWPAGEALLAFWQGQPVGVGFFSIIFPCYAYRAGIFLKDLYVLEAFQGKGLGRAMLAFVEKLGKEHGHDRIDWTTDLANKDAQRLYESFGAQREDKLFYRRRLRPRD